MKERKAELHFLEFWQFMPCIILKCHIVKVWYKSLEIFCTATLMSKKLSPISLVHTDMLKKGLAGSEAYLEGPK